MVDIEFTLFFMFFATFDIVHGNSPHLTMAKINFLKARRIRLFSAFRFMLFRIAFIKYWATVRHTATR